MADMERDDQLTIHIVEYAAREWGVNPGPILSLSAARTLPGPIQRGWARDLAREAEEEYADAINYVPWEIIKQKDLRPAGFHLALPHYMNALSATVYAFEQIQAAREALRLNAERCNQCAGPLLPQQGEFIAVLECEDCGRQIPR